MSPTHKRTCSMDDSSHAGGTSLPASVRTSDRDRRRPGPPSVCRDWPHYWFEVEATAYVRASGRTHARFEVEYELLVTNRLIFQPLVEVEVFGKSDPERGIGAGLSTMETGARLRYEFKREFAPYIGITWNRKFGKTADFAKAAGEYISAARLVTGLRLWF